MFAINRSIVASIWLVISTNAIALAPNEVVENHTDMPLDKQPDLDDYCWSERLDGCNIVGNFTRITIGLSFPVNIDCSQPAQHNRSNNIFNGPNIVPYFYERFQHVEVISLNGCGVNVSNRTHDHEHNIFGVEFIPDPLSVRHLTLEMFKVNGTPNGDAFHQFENMKSLLLTNNKIQRLEADTFDGLSLLDELVLQENHIESIDVSTFRPCNESLNSLVIHESDLLLGELMPIQSLSNFVVSTKQMDWSALTIGIDNMRSATISNVRRIVANVTAIARVFKSLVRLEVTFCDLNEFPYDRYPRLLHLNVSHNEIRNISLKEMQILGLQIFDISYNKFTAIDSMLLAILWDLEYFHATHNQIVAIHPKAFQKNYNLKVVDLSFNRLKEIVMDSAIFRTARFLKFKIDQNPFNCAWINEYYGIDPKVFASRLSYQKDYSNDNVKGLRCVYYSAEYKYHTHMYDDNEDQYHSGKTRRPSHPIDIFRRNPKHTALLTICILITGVSLLLVALFLCVKYRTLTSTLQQNNDYDHGNISNNSKEYLENRPDIIQHRMLMANVNCGSAPRLSIQSTASMSSPLQPASRRIHNEFASIEFKDVVDGMHDSQKSSLGSHGFDTMPNGAQKVVFHIEPDT